MIFLAQYFLQCVELGVFATVTLQPDIYLVKEENQDWILHVTTLLRGPSYAGSMYDNATLDNPKVWLSERREWCARTVLVAVAVAQLYWHKPL